MNDPVRVQVLQSLDDLHGIALDLKLMKSLSSFEQLIHALIVAKFKKDVHIFTVFEKVHELSYVLMFH